MPGRAGRLAGALADLVLPVTCAGCGEAPSTAGSRLRRGVCSRCAQSLLRLAPGAVSPTPAPAGLPPVAALGAYQGALRSVLLAYKERGRNPLAPALGALLAEAVTAVAPDGPLLLVPVPSTARAARARYGDHMARMARYTAARLRGAGRPVLLAQPLRALPRADSAGLTGAERAEAAGRGFRIRAGEPAGLRRSAAGARLVVLDDIVTTGVTLAAVAGALRHAGLPVSGAAVLAATRRRNRPVSPDRGSFPAFVKPTRG